MDTGPSRLHVGLYLLAIGVLSALTIGLLYAVFTAGLTDGIEAFLADPPGTIQENPLGLLGIASIFVALFVLFAAVVVGGARYADLDPDDTQQK